MRTPTPDERAILLAFLAGYVDQGQLRVIQLPKAVELLRPRAPRDVTLDSMTVARLLGRLGFRRSYAAADRKVITYRKAV